MKKQFYFPLLAFALTSNLAMAQIGINTVEPKATLDVVGNPTDNTSLDGIIPPRITAVQLKQKNYSSDQTGALIYVTENFGAVESNPQTRLISDIGYYMFNGVEWIPFKGTDPLYDVVNRGNFSPKFISFSGDPLTKQGSRDAALGYNPTTRSFFFGSLNAAHTGRNNVTYGVNTGTTLTTGYSNTLLGNDAGSKITTAFENTFLGKDAGLNLQTGMWNVAVGELALSSATDATFTTSVGDGSSTNTVGRLANNSSFGANSFKFSSGKNNTSLGTASGLRIVGDNNVFIGSGAGNYQTNSARTPLSNKLMIHAQQFADNGSNGGAGTFTENVGINTLIFGDFSERWLRINGGLQINPNYLKVASTDSSEILFYNKNSGNVSYSAARNFLTTSGTAEGNPITGQLEYVGGDTVGFPNTYGYYSQNDIKVSGFTIQNDGDLIPIIYVKDKTSNEVVNSLVLLSDSIVSTTKFSMGPKELVVDDTDLVSKEWVEDYVTGARGTISVPNPPQKGSYVLQSVDGIMTWVAN
jgi:hypothetical protein